MKKLTTILFLIIAITCGAQTRPSYYQVKDTPIIDVKQYGAAGNGDTNDTEEIQAAINALGATGGTVFFPAGTYKVTGPITINKSGVRLVGSGMLSTTISSLTTGTAISVDTGVFDAHSGKFWMSDLTLNAASATVALSLKWVFASGLDRTYIQSGKTGLYLDTCYYPYVKGCSFTTDTNGYYGIVGSASNHLLCDSTWFYNSAVDCSNITNAVFIQCDFEPCSATNIFDASKVLNCRFEQCNLYFKRTWIELKSFCKLEDNKFYFTGGAALTNLASDTPVIKITGTKNYVNFMQTYAHYNLITLDTGASHNTIEFNSDFSDLANSGSITGKFTQPIWFNGASQHYIFNQGSQYSSFIGTSANCYGDITSLPSANFEVGLASTSSGVLWYPDGLTATSTLAPIARPFGWNNIASYTDVFARVTIATTTGNIRLYHVASYTLVATTTVSVCALVYKPAASAPFRFGGMFGTGVVIESSDSWHWVFHQFTGSPGDAIQPVFDFLGADVNDVYYVGAVSVVAGGVPYFAGPTGTGNQYWSNTSFP